MRKLWSYQEKLDVHNRETKRVSVKGIVFKDNKILLVKSDAIGKIWFPGGGKHKGETDIETLSREMQEETGYLIDLESVSEFGYAEEIVNSTMNLGEVFHQISRYYFCQVKEQGSKHLDHYESNLHLQNVWLEPGEAIKLNDNHLTGIYRVSARRDNYILKLIEETIK